MEKELSLIDGILMNLAGIQSFYEFEHAHYSTLLQLSKKFQTETCDVEELKASNVIFMQESDKEIKEIESKIHSLEKKILEIKNDINTRKESKEKLISLFNSLKSVDLLDQASVNLDSNINSLYEPEMVDEDNFPIMEIREELDEDGAVVNSELKPYNSSDSELKALLEGKISQMKKEDDNRKNMGEKSCDKDTKNKIIGFQKDDKHLSSANTATNDQQKEKGFRPFVIREEIDEDGNMIKSSVSRIPQLTENQNENESHENEPHQDVSNDSKIEAIDQETEEVDDDQLEELFEDMGLVSKDEVIEIEHTKEESEIIQVPLNDTSESSTDALTGTRNSYNVDTDDLYTLEMIADELNGAENMDDEVEGEFMSDEEFEWPDMDVEVSENGETFEEEDEEDNCDDFEIQKRALSNMFGGKVKNMFAQKIMDLRNQKSSTESSAIGTCNTEKEEDFAEGSDITEVVCSKKEGDIEPVDASKHKKKSVKFNTVVDVKKVDNIWDDLRRSNIQNEINDLMRKKDQQASASKDTIGTSVFKKGRDVELKSESVSEEKDEKSNVVISDVFERQIVESEPVLNSKSTTNVFKTFDSVTVRKQIDDSMTELANTIPLTKLSGKKGPSRFKMARAAEAGKKFQETHITKEVREKLQEAATSFLESEKLQKTRHNVATDLESEDSSSGSEEKKKKSLFKTNLKSLNSHSQRSQIVKTSKPIQTPVDINPLPVNPTIRDEDYELIREEANESLYDDDEGIIEKEFIASNIISEPEFIDNGVDSNKKIEEQVKESNYFPEYKKEISDGEKEVVGTSLDYKTLGDDLDTMAKAYVLGLYDDDIETVGEVIEELDDFETHNKIVEDKVNSKLHERVDEINKTFDDPNGKIEEILEDNDPMVLTDIVENDMDEILAANAIPDDQLDIELNDDTLSTQVALDYTKMRSNMIHKYKGGFKETEKEKEFVRPEGSERVSRFKAARLGM